MLTALARTAALVALAGLLYLLLAQPASGVPAPGAAPGSLRLATLNVYALNPRVRMTSALLGACQADVLVALETTAHNLDRDVLRRAGYAVALDRHEGLKLGFGVTVLVRQGLRSGATLVPPPVRGACQPGVAAVRVELGETSLAVLGVHFAPPACTAVTGSALEACAGWIDGGRLIRDLGPCRAGDPVVVLGDFNVLAELGGWAPLERAGLQDCWSARHWRPGPTWAQPFGWPALVRIDGVMVPAAWDVLDSWTLDVTGSDHDVVVSDVRLPDP